MAYYYGKLQGSRGETTRLGTKTSGIVATLASYQGAVNVELFDVNGIVYVNIELQPWQGKGTGRLLFHRPVSGEKK